MAEQTGIPRAPSGLGRDGRRLWREVAGHPDYELEPAELALLGQAARTLDRIAELEAEVARDGPTVVRKNGDPAVHPALPEVARQRATFGRLVAQLRLPQVDDLGPRPPRRAARGAYRARRG